MNTELVKTTVKVGNSAGVLLPKEWLGTEVKVVLQPINIEKGILEILLKEDILKDVFGIYLAGSYARNEQGIESDVDVLVITNEINKRLRVGKYDFLLVSKGCLEKKMEKELFPILPMLIESKVIMNKDLKNNYVKTKLSWKNLRWYVETTGKMMKEVREDIDFSNKISKKVSDTSAYSLILRLRTLYIIDCLKNGKLWGKNQFLDLIKRISGSTIAYERYLQSKNYETMNFQLPVNEAENLRDYIIKKTMELKEWLKEKKD